MARLEILLQTPIPSFDTLREVKVGYEEPELDTDHPLHTELLASIGEYGIAGQSYYSRPNFIFDTGVPGVSQEILLRRSVVETLQWVNEQLGSRAVTAFFGAPVELYVEEGVRLYSVQEALYETYIPSLLRSENPTATDDEIAARRDQVIARPSVNASRPSPHASGGAVDVTLRYAQNTREFVDGAVLPLGHFDGDMSERINPDYFETAPVNSKELHEIQRNRRALYNALSGVAFGVSTGMTVNPTEFWHWDRGNRLWSAATGKRPYYGLLE